MTKLEDLYKSSTKDVQDELRNNGWASAYERLKKAMYDFGYTMSAGKEPEEIYDPELQEKVGEKGFRNDALLNALLEMDNDYRASTTGKDLEMPTLPSTLGLTPKEYVERSEEDMVKEVEEELLPELTRDKEKALEKLTKQEDKAREQEASAESSKMEEKSDLYMEGEEALLDHRDDMIFQGLINSTINEEGKKSIASYVRESERKIEEKYDKKLVKIRDDLALAKQEYESALEEYNLEYCMELTTKVNKLKVEEEKRREEINKYNAEIAVKEEKYQLEKQETLKKLREEREKALFQQMALEQSDEARNGVSEEKKLEYAKRTNTAKSFYQNFTKQEAMALILDAQDELKSLLGIDEYMKLLSWNSNRENAR